MGKYFGTDGMRGEVGVFLKAEHSFKIGKYLGALCSNNKKGRVVIGRDTRHSSKMLEYALASGAASCGADVYLLGVCPTACVSYITNNEGFDFGVMISASHNPFYDNGIKIINREGEKLSDEILSNIENYLDGTGKEFSDKEREHIGKINEYESGTKSYEEFLKSLSEAPLFGLRIGIDTAFGSAWEIAPRIFSSLGAEAHVLNYEPSGFNINESCGSTHVSALCSFVKENALDVGFAYDGDSDRCIAVDEEGREFDGDKILYALSLDLKRRGELFNDSVVATVMSNVGLKKSLMKQGIFVKDSPVGDRFVYEEMKKGDFSLGGEQSGHVIISKYLKTGDGILTSIKLAELLAIRAEPFSTLSENLILYPQILKNVRVKNKAKVLLSNALKEKIEEREKELDGRILVRASGTEPLIRILVEGKDKAECKKISKQIENIILKEDEA